MSDERTPQEIDDDVMEALLSLISNLAITYGRNVNEFKPQMDVIKDGVAELVRRLEKAA